MIAVDCLSLFGVRAECGTCLIAVVVRLISLLFGFRSEDETKDDNEKRQKRKRQSDECPGIRNYIDGVNRGEKSELS